LLLSERYHYNSLHAIYNRCNIGSDASCIGLAELTESQVIQVTTKMLEQNLSLDES